MTHHADNPLLAPWTTPYGLPPFDQIRPEHFAPAYAVALAAHRDEIDRLGAATEAPDFDSTAAAFDRSGRLLARVEGVFSNLCASETSPELQAVEREMAPQLAAHASFVYMHPAFFARLDAVHARRDGLGLTAEQRRLLERLHLDFVRAGARLSPEARRRQAEINERLATLMTQFSQNVLVDEATTTIPLPEDALDGLPEFVRASARQAAHERGLDGYAVTLGRSLIEPFLTFSARRDLRERAFAAWTRRGELSPDRDNLALVREILALRQEQASLHGFATYADYALSDTMAGHQGAVRELLEQVWQRARARAEQESAALLEAARAEGQAHAIEPWDWRYYAEKVRAARYDLDESLLKPYFQLDRMIEAMFDCAGRLFGLRFVEQHGVPLYHPDVRLFEVRDGRDQLIGIFLSDNFARPTKRSGAWMNTYRLQSRHEGGVLPIVVNNNNFARGADGQPTLLSITDVRTLFHEFGHGLHGLLSDVTYERLAGPQVLRDFVELPSQLFEYWALEPEVLRRHARHATTDAPIPDELLARFHRARGFNQGFEAVEYTSSALVDLALHAHADAGALDLAAFERAELARLGMPRGIVMRHRVPHFQHLFSGSDYASAYYVYLWAEVLDADAFEAFREAGDPFAPDVARRLREHIYASGNTREPREAYRAFRGRDPQIEPMLRKKGLATA